MPNEFDPPSMNGVYLLSVESVYDGFIVEGGANSHTVVERVEINGRYIGTTDYFETEYGFDALEGKVVHHENHIPWDNRPENIRLMSSSEHGRLHANEYWESVS